MGRMAFRVAQVLGNLIKLLVKKGVITKKEAKAVIKRNNDLPEIILKGEKYDKF